MISFPKFSWLRVLLTAWALLVFSTRVQAEEPPPADSLLRKTITEFGAVGDGSTLNTANIQAAIDELAAQGGGTLVIPAGTFKSGAIFLKPRVNLHLEEGAVLKGSPDVKDYPKMRTRIEGHFEDWLPALLNADGVDHLRISGTGTLDGNGAPFWKEFWERLKSNPQTTNLDVERPRLALIQNSQDVQVTGLTFKDSAFWNLHLYRCQEVVIEKVRFEVPDKVRCPSTDGTDIDSSQNVTIRGCAYWVDDDAVCMKGSKGPLAMDDGESPPVEHIRVIDCTFQRGHGAITLGSEATVVRDVVVERCSVYGKMPLARLKLRPDTPQLYENIHFRDITLDGAGSIFEVRPWTQFFDLQGQVPPQSIVREVTLTNLKGKFGAFGQIQGNPDQTEISNITLKDIDVQLKSQELEVMRVRNFQAENVIVNGKPLSMRSGE